MANPLFDALNGQQVMQQAPAIPTGPIQNTNAIMQAMRNPAAFVKQQFPDIPEDIANDPNQVLQYIQRTRNISNDQLNQIMNRFPRF